MQIILSLLLLISFNSFGNIIKVNYELKNYNISITNKIIEGKFGRSKATIYLKKCNQRVINNFKRRLEHIFEKSIHVLIEDPNFIKVRYNDSEYFFHPKSKEGQYFLNLPTELKRIAIESRLNCK